MDFLRVRPGATVVDCTLGLAGHAAGIARQLGPQGHLIGFDRDAQALALAKEKLDGVTAELGSQAPRVTLIGEAFSSIGSHLQPASVDGLLADFGVSSMQLDEAERGFSFQADGPLDMRQDQRTGPTAAQVVNELSERELADIVYQFGEERRSRRVARAIVYESADHYDGAISKDCSIGRPANASGKDTSCNQNLSSAPNLCQSRVR